MDLFWEIAPYLAQGAAMTVAVSIASMALALLVGLIIALLRLSRSRVLKFAAGAYVEVFRGTPLLVQLFIIYYGLPQYGIRLNAFTAGVIGLGLNYGAYIAEVYRAGILSVDKGQWEAGGSIGLSRLDLMRYVIVPQAIRVILPPVGNYFISMLKELGASLDDLCRRIAPRGATSRRHHLPGDGHLPHRRGHLFRPELSLLAPHSLLRKALFAWPWLIKANRPAWCFATS